MRCDTNCLTDWADEFNGNQIDFYFLSDLDDLVTAEPKLVFFSATCSLRLIWAYKDIFKDNVLYLIACELDFYQTKILWLGMI